MADKISESTWKAFSKKHKLELDDKELLKALAKLDKTAVTKPEPRLEALTEVIAQGKKLVLALAKAKKDIEKKLGAKTFDAAKDELHDAIEAAETLLKEASEAQQQAATSEQDEVDSPALLTSKMVPLIRELRKGQATMFSLVALAGKETVVLISRRSISPARGKLLKEQMSNPAGLKFIRGECLYEENTLTFVVQAPAAGLAKRLKAALLAQTELRLKVRVRGEDPNDVDEEEEEPGEGAIAAQAQPGQDVPAAPPQPKQAYEQMLAELLPRVKQAAGEGRGGSDAAKHEALLDFAAGKAGGQDFLAAVTALRRLAQMLDTPTAAQPGPESGANDAGAAFNARLAALLPRLKEAMTAGLADAQALKLQASEAGMLGRKKEFTAANALLAEVERALGSASPRRGAQGQQTEPREAPASVQGSTPSEAVEKPQAPSSRWEAVRAKVVARLQREIKAVVATQDPDAGQAELELRAVLKQLSGEMRTRQQAAEMTRFLEEDEVVADVSELAFDLKTPLQQVLAEITPQLSA